MATFKKNAFLRGPEHLATRKMLQSSEESQTRLGIQKSMVFTFVRPSHGNQRSLCVYVAFEQDAFFCNDVGDMVFCISVMKRTSKLQNV